MGFKGKYEWYSSQRLAGRSCVSFKLSFTDFFGSVSFNCTISNVYGQLPPKHFSGLNLEARHCLDFNYDTVDWDWCKGDVFILFGVSGKEISRWELNESSFGNQTIPVRQINQSMQSLSDCSGRTNDEVARQRKLSELRNREIELIRQIENVVWTLRMMELKNQNVSSYSLYRSYLYQKLQYETQLGKIRENINNLMC